MVVRKKVRRVTSQTELIRILMRLKPRYRIRLPMKDKRGPFVVKVNGDVPGNVIKLPESLFEKLRDKDRLVLVRVVNNKEYQYKEFRYKAPEKKTRKKKCSKHQTRNS